VGPITRKKTSRTAATYMLIWLSQLIPFSMAVEAEIMNAIVVSPITRSCTAIPVGVPKVCPSPAVSCSPAEPSETATPKRTARTDITSIALPRGPSTRSPSRGLKTGLMSPGSSLRKLKYPTASPTTAYMAHGCSVQWKYEYCIATWAASVVPGLARPKGGAL
jgi:hypothetical protein